MDSANKLTPFSLAVIDLIIERMENDGLSANTLASKIDMSQPTLSRTMRKKRPFDTEELSRVCGYFSIRISTLARQAEARIKQHNALLPNANSTLSPAVSVDPARAYIDETQAKLARVLSRTDLTPAAKQHQNEDDSHA